MENVNLHHTYKHLLNTDFEFSWRWKVSFKIRAIFFQKRPKKENWTAPEQV